MKKKTQDYLHQKGIGQYSQCIFPFLYSHTILEKTELLFLLERLHKLRHLYV